MSIGNLSFRNGMIYFVVALFTASLLVTTLVGLYQATPVGAIPYNVERVQFDFASGVDPTANLGATPEEGNLLVATAFSRTGNSTATHSISGSDWVKRVAHDTALGNQSTRRALSVWTKTAGAAEPTSIQITGDNVRMLVQEFGSSAAGNFVFLEAASNDNGVQDDENTAPTTVTTGATSELGGNTMWVSALGIRNGKGVNINSASWDVTGNTAHQNGGGWGATLNSGWALDNSTSAKEDTASWTGKNTGASAAVLVFAAPDMCAFAPQDGRTIVDMYKYAFIRSDKSQSEATHGPFGVNLPAGTYDVSLHSYDDHSGHGGQNQPAESWYAILDGASGNVATTNAISDLPENDDFITELVNSELVLAEDVTQVTAFHAAYPDKNPNSIYPICVAFDEVVEDGEVEGDQVEDPEGAPDTGVGFSESNTAATVGLISSLALLAAGIGFSYKLVRNRE